MRISDWSSDVCSSDLAAKTIDRLIEAGPVRLADAARESDLSLGRFRHLFTAEIGMPFQRYVLWRRLLIAFDAIGGQHSATEAAHMAGRSEEHTSELQSLMRISYAVFCLEKKNVKLPPANN